jgi:hypothetical protein
MKKTTFVMLAGLCSASAYAQLGGNLLQSVTDQLNESAQRQVAQGVQSATESAVQATTDQARRVVESQRKSADGQPSGDAAGDTHP